MVGLFYEFAQHVSSVVRSTGVCSATFRRELLLQLLNPYHIISVVTALQAAAQLEIACPFFLVLRDEHLCIDRPVRPIFAWPAAAGSFVCYTAAIRLAAIS